jgi:hypothetical protein
LQLANGREIDRFGCSFGAEKELEKKPGRAQSFEPLRRLSRPLAGVNEIK